MALRGRRFSDEMGPIIKLTSAQIHKIRDITNVGSFINGNIYKDINRKKNVVIKHPRYEAQCKPPVQVELEWSNTKKTIQDCVQEVLSIA